MGPTSNNNHLTRRSTPSHPRQRGVVTFSRTPVGIAAIEPAMREAGESLQSLLDYSRSLGMEPLVEVVTEDEVDVAATALPADLCIRPTHPPAPTIPPTTN